jgi:predicted NBD/HSP70 family sugar kinase
LAQATVTVSNPTAVSHHDRILAGLYLRGRATRADLARHLHIRPGSVGAVCEELIAEGRVRRCDPQQIRNIDLKLVPDQFLALGVEHRRDQLVCALVDAANQPVEEHAVDLPADLTGPPRMEHIARHIATRVDAHRDRIVGVGFCDIGMVDAPAGRSIRAAALPGWQHIELRDPIEQIARLPGKVHLPYKLDAYAAAERAASVARGMDQFIFVMLSRTIGLSVWLGDRFLRGNLPIAGELGHIVIDPNGEVCTCGNRGCLETIASSDAIVRHVEQQAQAAIGGALPRKLDIDLIVQNAQQGNKFAERVITEAATAVGEALAPILSILGIRDVVFAGDLPQAGDLFFNTIAAVIQRRCIAPLNRAITLHPATLDDRAIARGAGCAALRHHFVGE